MKRVWATVVLAAYSLSACAGRLATNLTSVAADDTPETAARRYREADARFDYQAAVRAANSWRALAPSSIAAVVAEAEAECSLADLASSDGEVEPHVDRALALVQPLVDARSASMPVQSAAGLELAAAEALGLRARQRGAGAAMMLKSIYTHAKASVDLDPNYEQGAARRLLAVILVKAPGWPQGPGDFDGGVKMLEDYVAQYPRVAQGYIHLADAYLDAHRVRDGENALTRARPLLGKNPRARKLFEQTEDRIRVNHNVKSY